MTTDEDSNRTSTLSAEDQALIQDIRMNVGMDEADFMEAVLASE